jgi:hypothetical protein
MKERAMAIDEKPVAVFACTASGSPAATCRRGGRGQGDEMKKPWPLIVVVMWLACLVLAGCGEPSLPSRTCCATGYTFSTHMGFGCFEDQVEAPMAACDEADARARIVAREQIAEWSKEPK